jgi:hypothetical protein
MGGDWVRRPSGAALLCDCWPVVLTVILLWPLRLAGYGLGRDLVFTPRQPFSVESVGLGSGLPRAVPLDALVALLSRALDGAVLGRLALFLPLVAAGWGARRLLRSPGMPASLAAAGFAVWNPFVVERLALGQWALLWAYGALPWLVLAGARLRADAVRLGDWAAAIGWLAASAITPTGGLIGAAALIVVGVSRVPPRTVGVIGIAVAVQLPWLVPSLLSPAGATSDPAAIAAFASRAERSGGVLASLFGLGGIWDRGATPASRSGMLGYLTTAVVVLALVLGAPTLVRLIGTELSRRLAGLASLGLALAVWASVPGGATVLRWFAAQAPGAGLLRDAQKWLLPFVLFAVLCVGATIDELSTRLPRISGAAPAMSIVVVLGLVLPAVLLPDAAATVKPTLTPVHYPADWYRASKAVNGAGDVLVLPFASYRRFPWMTSSSVIDPAPRWLSAETVVNDQLVVSGRVLAGEDRQAREVSALLVQTHNLAADLASSGIGWVWVEKDTAGPALPDLRTLQLVVTGSSVDLYRVPGTIATSRVPELRRTVVVVVDGMIGIIVLVSICISGATIARRLLDSPVT